MAEAIALDTLDEKANAVFGGRVVRKGLVCKVKVGANVPVYVLEYLLGKYCATDDPQAVEVGLRLVNDTLAENFVCPDEAMKAQSRVKEQDRHRFIDEVKVRLDETKYWAELVNFGHRHVHVPDHFVRKYERLLEGGVWAQVTLEYIPDESVAGRVRPFYIMSLSPSNFLEVPGDLIEKVAPIFYSPPDSGVEGAGRALTNAVAIGPLRVGN